MGKQVHRNLTERNCDQKMFKQKTKRILKNRKRLMSQSVIQETQQLDKYQIGKNVKTVLKNLSKECSQKKNRKLSSLLGLVIQPQINCSIQNIPSIENMISQKNLKSYNQQESYDGYVSFDSISSFFVIQDQPDLMLNYLVLLQKTYSKISVKLSSSQNEKVIKGLWNICLKFWQDDGQQKAYEDIGFQIQWGLFQLLNFSIIVTNKQRILMRQKLKQLKVKSKIF